MAVKNETVKAVLREIDETHETWKRSEIANLPTQYLKEWHDRIEAAHKREVAELRECLKEAVGFFDELSEGIKVAKGFLTMFNKWRKALEGANDDNASRKDH